MWTTEQIINKLSNPLPAMFPATFDLMPLMSFQQAVDPNLELCHILGSVSINLGSKRQQFKSKDHAIRYTRKIGNPQATDVFMEPRAPEDTIKQKAFWNQILDDLGAEFEELNIETRVPMVDAPSQLDVDSLILLQTKTGNFTQSIRRRFGLLGIRNPYRLMKTELVEKELWQKSYAHKLRGILKTTNFAGFDNNKVQAWNTLVKTPKGHRFPPTLTKINDKLVKGKWWQDNGLPIKMLGAANSTEVEAILYRLKQREVVITA